MKKLYLSRITRSTTPLSLRTEVIRVLGTVDLGIPVGGCKDNSSVSGEPTHDFGRGENANINPTCPMM